MIMKFNCGFLLIFLGFCILDSKGIPADIKSGSISRSGTVQNKNKEKTAEDDSDMLMEPDELSHIDVVRSESQQIFPTTTNNERSDRLVNLDANTQAAAQNFYPTYYRESPPLGHSRPYYQIPEGVPNANIQTARSLDQSILGSGDFGVIRGGTFYTDDETPYHPEEPNGYGFFFGDNDSANNNNGHGRPHADAFVQKFTYPEEQFANFRDFAEINTPTDSAFSQFIVVYANKNSTNPTHHPNPKNIFEQLELLDQEKAQEEKKNRITRSKAKAKLASTKLEKKYKKHAGPKDIEYEPLLALS